MQWNGIAPELRGAKSISVFKKNILNIIRHVIFGVNVGMLFYVTTLCYKVLQMYHMMLQSVTMCYKRVNCCYKVYKVLQKCQILLQSVTKVSNVVTNYCKML